MSAHLTFAEAPFGLEPLTAFTLADVEGGNGLFTLTAELDPGTRLFLLDAGAFLTDYLPVLTDEQCAAIDVTRPEDVLLLVVANSGEDAVTVNLLAPIVVNAHTGAAAQIILEGDWPLRAELAAHAR
jgi:flagellar assembly factor FliW